MHKALKVYLIPSRGNLLRVVRRIKQMVNSQYNKYRKEIASSRHRVKFGHISVPHLNHSLKLVLVLGLLLLWSPCCLFILLPSYFPYLRQQYLERSPRQARPPQAPSHTPPFLPTKHHRPAQTQRMQRIPSFSNETNHVSMLPTIIATVSFVWFVVVWCVAALGFVQLCVIPLYLRQRMH